MAVLVSVLAAVAAATGAHPAVITNPDWLRKPSGEDLEAHYPKLMQQMQVEGQAVLQCDITVQGDAVNCSAPFESPVGLGFGQAAISLAPLMKFTPKTIDGVASPGGTVRTTIRFQLEGAAGDATASAAPPAGVDARTRALAQRMIGLTDAQLFESIVTRKLARLEAESAGEGDPASRRRMVDAYLVALRLRKPVLDQMHANLILSRMTAEQIAAALAFLETPTGQIMIAKADNPVLAVSAKQGADIQAFMNSETGHTFIAAMNETILIVGKQLDAQAPDLAAAAMKAYCAQPGSCPTAAPSTP